MEWAIEEAKRQEAARIARIEARRAALFERGSERYSKYLELRRYLDAVKAEAFNRAGAVDQGTEIGKWLTWAQKHVESANPLSGELPIYGVDDPGTYYERKWPSQ